MTLKSKNFIPASSRMNLKPLKLPDCIYLSEHCRCDILRISECRGDNCPFKKDSLEHQKAYRRWLDHMNALSDELQQKAASAYYGGKMLWK